MNILYHEGKPYVTDKETFPTKPPLCTCNLMESADCMVKCSSPSRNKAYEEALADFIRDCTPIRDEDQELVKRCILISITDFDPSMPPPKVVDHTIYKVEIELREEQIGCTACRGEGSYSEDVAGDGRGRETFTCDFCEGDGWTRAFKIVETKEI